MKTEIDKRMDSFVQKLDSSSILSIGSGMNFGEGDTDEWSQPTNGGDSSEFKW